VAIVDHAGLPVYLKIAEKAKHLRELGMGDRAIARALGVSDKAVAKPQVRSTSTHRSSRVQKVSLVIKRVPSTRPAK
jgi:predicted transcriptional regulator